MALSGDNGLFKRAKEARNEYEKASIDEEDKLKEYEDKISEELEGDSIKIEQLFITEIFASSEFDNTWLKMVTLACVQKVLDSVRKKEIGTFYLIQ